MKIIRLTEVPIEERGGYRIKRIITKKLNFRPKNIGVYQTIIPPQSRCPNHAHGELDEILFFLTEAKVRTQEDMLEFREGDLLIISPNEFHEIIAEDHEIRLIALKLPNIVTDRING
jgi:quercetin dioxygenase-like cupin family protein